MKAAGIRPAPGAGVARGRNVDAEALIKEARRRQRRRYLAVSLALAVATAAALGVLAGLGPGGHPQRHRRPRPTPAVSHPAGRGVSGPVLGSRAGSTLMWPISPASGDRAYLADLRTGRVSLVTIPANVDGGDVDPYLIRAGRWLVYKAGSRGGTLAIPGDLRGRPRVLGSTFQFAPAAAPGRVWLIRGTPLNPETSARSVQVAGGPPGRAVRLPAGSFLVEGTDAGLLLISRRGDLELWMPGRGAPAKLAHLPGGVEDGFAADNHIVAYGIRCGTLGTSASAEFQFGYTACRTLQVLNLLTGKSRSFPAPPGTSGWVPPVPSGFNMDNLLAPGDRMMAAEAVVGPRLGLVRV